MKDYMSGAYRILGRDEKYTQNFIRRFEVIPLRRGCHRLEDNIKIGLKEDVK
jgi:hypothetical protein